MKFNAVSASHFLKLLSKKRVRSDAATNAQAIAATLLQRLLTLSDQNVNGCRLEAGGDVGDSLFRQRFGFLVRTGNAFDRIKDGRFETAETEFQAVLFQKRPGKSNRLRVSLFGDWLNVASAATICSVFLMSVILNALNG